MSGNIGPRCGKTSDRLSVWHMFKKAAGLHPASFLALFSDYQSISSADNKRVSAFMANKAFFPRLPQLRPLFAVEADGPVEHPAGNSEENGVLRDWAGDEETHHKRGDETEYERHHVGRLFRRRRSLRQGSLGFSLSFTAPEIQSGSADGKT